MRRVGGEAFASQMIMRLGVKQTGKWKAQGTLHDVLLKFFREQREDPRVFTARISLLDIVIDDAITARRLLSDVTCI